MTVVLAFGSETGDSSECTVATGTLDFAYTAVKGSGTYGLRHNPVAAASVVRVRGVGASGAGAELALTTAYAGAWVTVVAAPDAAFQIITLTNSANSIMAGIRLNAAGEFDLFYVDGTDATVVVTDTFTPTLGVPCYLEIGVTAAGTVGAATVEGRINGQFYGSASGLTLRSASRTLDRTMHGTGGAHTSDIVIDDVYVDNAGFLGNINIEMAPAAGAGATSQWNEGTGNTFAEVNELPHTSDTDYIKESSTAQVSLFTVGASSPFTRYSYRLACLKAGAVVRDEVAVSSVSLRLRGSSATNADTTAADPGATYVLRSSYHNTDPGTSARWTTDGADAAQVGVVTAAAAAIRATSLWIQFVYLPHMRNLAVLGVG
jgi:hypothetical protein